MLFAPSSSKVDTNRRSHRNTADKQSFLHSLKLKSKAVSDPYPQNLKFPPRPIFRFFCGPLASLANSLSHSGTPMSAAGENFEVLRMPQKRFGNEG